jgi:carbon monoxide dehydrogenase subunit G
VQLTSAIRIGRPAPEVLDALLDAGMVAACLPGSRLIGEVAEGTYAGEIRLRIGPVHAVYAGTVRLAAADRAAGTATLQASGRDRGGQGSADANVTLRVEPRGASTRVLISADLMIRGTVAQYAPGAIGDVGQRLVEQFAGNVEQLLAQTAPDRDRNPARLAAGTGLARGTDLAVGAGTGSAAGPDPAAGPDATGGAPAAHSAARRAAAAKRAAVAAAVLLAAGALAAGMAVWRRRHLATSLSPDTPWHFSHEGAGHG